jgi:glycosyltransferase involved in cell wall biosynthesis
MDTPKVSVIIPAYNGGDYLREAIQSVLTQSYPHLELIVVDDKSPEDTGQIIKQFDDPRLKYLVHQENQGAVAARKTGVDASSGEIIAFLDQDDFFHPEKLQTHVTFLAQNSAIGLTYNARFELQPNSKEIRTIWQPPPSVTLADLVLGFPFSPSDTVLRRALALQADIWDQSYVLRGAERIFNGAEMILGGRLALAGYNFANVGRALNYRRYHPRRVFSNLAGRCTAERTCQEMILTDPRCPDKVRALHKIALMNTYLIWAYYAFAQDETALGQAFLREAVHYHPPLLADRPAELVKFMMTNTAADGSVDLADHLRKIFDQFPHEMKKLATQLDWAIARGYLIRGTQAILWGRPEDGRHYLIQAIAAGAQLDELYIQNLTAELLNHQNALGAAATRQAIDQLVPCLEKASTRNSGRWLRGSYSINQAFQSYRIGDYAQVPRKVVEAISHDPRYLLNRGVLSILFRASTPMRLARA